MTNPTLTKCASWQEAQKYPGYKFTASSLEDALEQFDRSPNKFDPVEIRYVERWEWNEYNFVRDIPKSND